MPVIMLDTGHGGYDTGTSRFGLIGKDLALSIAIKVQGILNKNSVTVHMKRTMDRFITLGERAQMANDYDADLFVS